MPMPNYYPTVPVLITATGRVLIGTPEHLDQGFLCSIETTDDRDRATLTTDGITMTKRGIEIYIKCLAAGFTAAAAQAIDHNIMADELLPLLLHHINLFKETAAGGTGKPIAIVTPGQKPSSN